jgi:hypothetical protein
MKRRRRSLLDGRAAGTAALALFFLPLLPLVFGLRALVFRDAFITHFPIARWAAMRERGGIVPFLNFAASNVEPLLPNPNTVALYPTHLLFRVLPPAAAFNLHLLFHVAWAFFGAAYLARRLGAGGAARWVGGAAYAFSGPYLSYASAFTNAAAAAAWAPWAVACAVRLSGRTGRRAIVRPALALAIAVGLQLLAGEPAISAWTIAACAVPFLARLASAARSRLSAPVAGGTAAAVLALAISAPLLLATRAAIPWSFRGEHLFSRDQFNAARNVPLRLLETLLPLVFGSPRPLVSGTFWAYAPFDSLQPYLYSLNFGLAAVFLVGAALAIPAYRRSRTILAAGIATLVFFLLSFGFGTPLFELLYAIPPLRHFRYPIKFALPAALGVSVLAALAFRELRESAGRFPGAARAAALVAAVLAASAAAVLWAPKTLEALVAPSFRTLRFGPAQVLPGIATSILRDAAWGAGGMLLAALALSRLRGAARGAALLAAVLATLLPAGWPLFVSVPAAPYVEAPPLAAFAQGEGRAWVGNLPEFAVAKFGTKHSFERDDVGDLILAGRRELWPLTGIPDGISYSYDKDPDGSYGFLDRVFSEAVAVKTPEERSRLLAAASVRFAIAPEGDALPGFAARSQTEVDRRSVVVSEALRPVPIVRVAERVFSRSSLSGAVDLVASPKFDPMTDAVLRGPDRDPTDRLASGRADEITQAGNGLRARISSREGTVAVFAATYFRYWKASIDGATAPVEIANGNFCGVRVPPGTHRVELFYDERPFRAGAWLSLGAAVLAIFVTVAMRRSRPARGA